MWQQLLLLLSVLAGEQLTSASELGRSEFLVDTVRNRIVDLQGRTRFFHGTNVVYKTDPFVPDITTFDAKESFCEEDADLLASMGYNSIRLGVLWAGVEPIEGEYNSTYLDLIEAIVNMAGARGIYSLLDMHQDVFNRKFCGNGVPDWAAVHDKYNFPYPLEVEYPVDENGHPSREDCDRVAWPNYHFSTALEQSVGHLYQNYDGLRDKFVLFWTHVAERFADNTFVLGYEIMNEPWCGNTWQEPDLLIPGVADRRYLEPLYDEVNRGIRSVDESHLIFFESVTWEIVDFGASFGFSHPPGGNDFRNRSVLSFHNSVQPQVTSDEDYYDLRLEQIQRLGIAGFVTENGQGTHDLLDDLSRWGYSWHHWSYKWYGNWTWDSRGYFLTNGYDKCEGSMEDCLNVEEVLAFARVYPQAVAGEVHYFHFDIYTRESVMVYTPSPDIAAPTILSIPSTWQYADTGYDVTITPADLATWASGGDFTIEISLSEEWEGQEITVVVTPKSTAQKT